MIQSTMKEILGKSKGYNGWTILQGDDCIKVRHDATKRVFTLKKIDDLYWNVWVASPMIDGPKKAGDLILKIQGLRNALVAIGFLRRLN